MILPFPNLHTACRGPVVSVAVLASIWSCSPRDDGPNQGVIARETNPSASDPANEVTTPVGEPGGVQAPSSSTDTGNDIGQLPTDGTTSGPVMECASTSQPTELQGVTLVFAFDVSGSMASDEAARQFKWEPVTLAAKTFFSSPDSADVSAQLTFFPGASVGGGGPNVQATCTSDDYLAPDIPLTLLPSERFGTTIDATQPNRLGTPTRWILPAVIEQAIALRDEAPSSYAVVLVTDGLPTSCASGDADDVNEVAALAAAGPAAGIPVYVIGVDTPADATVGAGENGIANLNLIAAQGGTESAFIIDTGDVDKTVADFVSVVNTIKESTFACAISIPKAPAGQSFDATKVNVTFKSDQQQDLVYDPTCATDWSWKYDNEQDPTSIVLCDVACASVKSYSTTAGSVDVQFGCERRVVNR